MSTSGGTGGGAIAILSGNLAANVALPAATATTIMTLSTLAVGTWLLTAVVTLAHGTTPTAGFEVSLGYGSAAGTYTGARAGEYYDDIGAATPQPGTVTVSAILTVTTAGQPNVAVRNNDAAVAGTAYMNTTGGGAISYATGYTAVRLA